MTVSTREAFIPPAGNSATPARERTVYRSPRRHRRTCAFWATLACLGLGCSGSSEPAGPNYACFRALDCEDGLVCVQGRCTSDISAIVPEGAGTAPAPAAAGDAGAP